MKVVINSDYGGFGLSYEAMMLYAERAGITLYPAMREVTKPWSNATYISYDDQDKDVCVLYPTEPITPEGKLVEGSLFRSRMIERNDPILISVVEDIGCARASGLHSSLKIVEIPDGTNFVVQTSEGGIEWIAEVHRTWS